MSDPKQALEKAIAAAGTVANLARGLGITMQAVHQWNRVPTLQVLKVERLTGIPRHELRPDIYPPEVSMEPASCAH